MKKLIAMSGIIVALAGVELYACTWAFAPSSCESVGCGSGCSPTGGYSGSIYVCQKDPTNGHCCECDTRFQYCQATGGGDCPTGNGIDRSKYDCEDCVCETQSHRCV